MAGWKIWQNRLRIVDGTVEARTAVLLRAGEIEGGAEGMRLVG